MDGLKERNSTWWLNDTTLSNATMGSNFTANASNSIDPALAACYNLPYGGMGMVWHSLLMWGTLWLCYGHRPLVFWKQLFSPRTDMVLCSVSLLEFVIAAIFSFTSTGCGDNLVLATMITHHVVTPMFALICTILSLGIRYEAASPTPSTVRERRGTKCWVMLKVFAVFLGLSLASELLLTVIFAAITSNDGYQWILLHITFVAFSALGTCVVAGYIL